MEREDPRERIRVSIEEEYRKQSGRRKEQPETLSSWDQHTVFNGLETSRGEPRFKPRVKKNK